MKSVHANPPEKICRLCLSDSGVILPIFEGEVAERFSVPLPQKILSCLAIKVCADDPLPPHICHRCLYEVDRFHEFRETCKRTNTTFNKICNNSSESVPFDVNQVLEIKQELHDESVYHDAISDLLSDEEGSDLGSSRIRKRNRCLSLLESMKRVQQAQSAASATATQSELPAEWIEQAKTTTPSNTTTSSSSHISPQLECRFCAKPFLYESTLLEHEELHAKGVVTEEDSIEPMEQSSIHESLVPVQSPTPNPVSTPVPVPPSTPGPIPITIHTSTPGPIPTLVHTPTSDPSPTATSASAPPPTPTVVSTLVSVPDPAPTPTPVPVPVSVSAPVSVPVSLSVPVSSSGPVVQQAMEVHNPSAEQETAHQVQHAVQSQPQEAVSHTVVSHSSVETVSLTDVTAMLLEEAFEGDPTPNPCKYCQEQFNNPDLLRRHERMYCNQRPSLIKHKQPMQQQQQQQQLQEQQQLQQQQIQQPQQMPQHPQSSHQAAVEQQLTSDAHQHGHPHAHHLVVHQQHQLQGLQVVQAPQPQHPEQQQIIFSQKVVVEAPSMEPTRSCKHCHKDFIHRGSLWRHQMFCDANPEREINRIVAESKKKSVVVKNCDIRSDTLQHVGGRGHSTGVTASPLRRGGIQTSSGPFKCKFCEKRFLHRGSWWRHQKMFCAVNPDIPTVKAEIKVRNTQGAPNFTCRYCNRTFLHRGSCWHHEQTHTGVKEHGCRYCSKTFNEKSRLARHERMHLGIKPFSCRKCGKAFCDASNLRNHEQIHGERASFLCAWCGKSYTRRALLLKHEQIHAGEGDVFPCPSCPRTFPDTELLHDHVMTHNEDKKRFYLCQSCGETFRSKSLLSQHNLQNHQHVPHPSQQHSQPQQVAQHIQPPLSQLHQRQEQQHHSCNICSKTFSDVPSLRHHELMHDSAPRQYHCSHAACNAAFHQQAQLDAHLLMHQGEKAHSLTSSVVAASSTSFHHQQPQQQQQQLTHPQQQHAHPQQQLMTTHEIAHPQSLQHHELLHREGTYVIEEQDLTGQTISVHHLVSQIP